jgi:hypothetical protein
MDILIPLFILLTLLYIAATAATLILVASNHCFDAEYGKGKYVGKTPLHIILHSTLEALMWPITAYKKVTTPYKVGNK